MKRGVGGVVLALVITNVAFAQTGVNPLAPSSAPPLPTQCGAIATAPVMPDGARASAAQMHNADTAYRAWAGDTEAKLHCRAAEIQAADDQVKAAAADFQALSASARAASEAYNAAVRAFNARGGNARGAAAPSH